MKIQQAEDFRQECHALLGVLENCSNGVFTSKTQFKDWSIEDVIGHLHIFNVAARLTLENDQKFEQFYKPISTAMATGKSMIEAQDEWLAGLSGKALLEAWREEFNRVADRYAEADPKSRVKWAGPDMSARSSITARQMETWAHGQEIFDLLGVMRHDTDRIKNIAHLGVSTYGWTFTNRNEPVPEPAPYVKLTAPSGAIWEWNKPQINNSVEGDATEFCQVVVQTRNIADTNLVSIGPKATRWMSIAQCFAGPPHESPAPRTRYTLQAE